MVMWRERVYIESYAKFFFEVLRMASIIVSTYVTRCCDHSAVGRDDDCGRYAVEIRAFLVGGVVDPFQACFGNAARA
jgi:hypothetical protein